ncbi:MAG: hypothetical protein IPM49_12215 [Flavobacteriales bacterium]|nr:hypothetical protein [Flavobacteriales bacterium]
MKDIVLLELLRAIKRILATGEEDLTGLPARLLRDGEVLQVRMKGRWVSLRRSNLATIIAAVKERVEQAKPGKKPKQRKA